MCYARFTISRLHVQRYDHFINYSKTIFISSYVVRLSDGSMMLSRSGFPKKIERQFYSRTTFGSLINRESALENVPKILIRILRFHGRHVHCMP